MPTPLMRAVRTLEASTPELVSSSRLKLLSIRPAPASNTTLPTVQGSTIVGQTLSSSDGSWAGLPSPTLSRQWNRNGSPINGATAGWVVVALLTYGLLATPPLIWFTLRARWNAPEAERRNRMPL